LSAGMLVLASVIRGGPGSVPAFNVPRLIVNVLKFSTWVKVADRFESSSLLTLLVLVVCYR
jgi:hypothetical protein